MIRPGSGSWSAEPKGVARKQKQTFLQTVAAKLLALSIILFYYKAHRLELELTLEKQAQCLHRTQHIMNMLIEATGGEYCLLFLSYLMDLDLI